MRAFLSFALLCALGCGDDDLSRDDQPECPTSSCHRDVDASVVRDAALDARMSPPDSNAAPAPATTINFVPADHQRWTSDAGLGVAVSVFERTRNSEVVLQELADALELVRWPSGERVAIQVKVEPSQPLYSLQLAVTPVDTLGDGEYAMRFNPMPARVQVQKAWPNDGLDVSRFYVGSQPAVLRIQLCEKADARTKVIVTFSEAMRRTSPKLKIFDRNALQECTEPVYDDHGFEVVCTYVPSGPARLVLEGFESTSGVALRTPDLSFAPSTIVSGCASYAP
jgi:hypothetical protein